MSHSNLKYRLNKKWIPACMLVILPLLGKTQVVSDFSSGLDSWSTFNEGAGGAPTTVNWSATGGNPGGYISAQDISVGAWYWFGPSKFRGNLSSYYGCYLTFDLKEDSHLGIMNYYDVMFFNNAGDTMVFDTGSDPLPINTWISYTVQLTTGVGWKYGSSIAGAAPAATSAQMTAILSDVKRMRIRAEYSGLTYETDGLDNVVLSCTLVLPIQLTDFTATKLEDHHSRLDWTTQSETNCVGFVIEKSTDFGSFDSIGFVPGNGTTSEANSYSFIDPDFDVSSYYRLKEVNEANKLFYSNILYLKSDDPIAITTYLYPNPASTVLNLLATEDAPLRRIDIVDISGRLMYSEDIEDYSGRFTKQIDIHTLPAGIYTLIATKSTGTTYQKFSVVR